MIISPPSGLTRSLQVLAAAADSRGHKEFSGSEPRGLSNFDVPTLILQEKTDTEARELYEQWLHQLPKKSQIEFDILGMQANPLMIPEQKKVQYFYAIEYDKFNWELTEWIQGL